MNEFEGLDGLVLVDFYTAWCPPCKMLAPVLDKLKDVAVHKVDLEESPEAGVKYRVSAVPTVVFLKDGVEVDRFVGVKTEQELQAKIDTINQGA